MGQIDIQPDHLKLVLGILGTHLPHTEIWAFGSRVTGQAKPFSDLDLTIVSGAYAVTALTDARQAFEDSNLPYKVDLIPFADLPDTLQAGIRTMHEVIQQP